MKLKLESIAFF